MVCAFENYTCYSKFCRVEIFHLPGAMGSWTNEKNYFSKTKINFYKKTTPQLLEHILATNYESRSENKFGWLAAVCLMHADISS